MSNNMDKKMLFYRPLTKEEVKQIGSWSRKEILVMGYFVVTIFSTSMLGIFLGKNTDN